MVSTSMSYFASPGWKGGSDGAGCQIDGAMIHGISWYIEAETHRTSHHTPHVTLVLGGSSLSSRVNRGSVVCMLCPVSCRMSIFNICIICLERVRSVVYSKPLTLVKQQTPHHTPRHATCTSRHVCTRSLSCVCLFVCSLLLSVCTCWAG